MSLERYIQENGGLTRDDLLFLASVGLRYLTCETAHGREAVAVTQAGEATFVDASAESDAQAETPPQVPRHGVTPLQRQFMANLVSNYATHRVHLSVAAIEAEPEEGFFLFADAVSDAINLETYLVTKDYEREDRWLDTKASAKLITSNPVDAAELTGSKTLDFVVIGNVGSREDALLAIEAWVPKLKHSGLIVGGMDSLDAASQYGEAIVKEYADNGAWLMSAAHLRDREQQEAVDGEE